MNVAVVKSGNRGRPRFRRSSGVIFPSGTHWAFCPDSLDLFGGDSVLLSVPANFPIRAKNRINTSLRERGVIPVVLSFSGASYDLEGRTFFDCRFVGFPTFVK